MHDHQGQRIAEYDAGGASLLREYYWLGAMPVAVVEGGQVYYVRTDHIGRPAFATEMIAGQVYEAWRAEYLPFGSVDVTTGTTPIALRFPGQWFQLESGLHQNWHRDYDPTTGRYLQADPLGLIDGPSVYGYALQNPMRYTDLRGLEAGVIVWGPSGWGQSSFGHVSAFVDDEAFSWGPGGCSCGVDRDDYNERNSFREGEVYILNLNSSEEYIFRQCLIGASRQSYSLLFNNCTDPVERCLAELLYPVGNSLLPRSLGGALANTPGLVNQRVTLPQSTPKEGSLAPWAK